MTNIELTKNVEYILNTLERLAKSVLTQKESIEMLSNDICNSVKETIGDLVIEIENNRVMLYDHENKEHIRG